MSVLRNGITSADLEVPVVLPTLNLDFANSQNLDKRITFTRGSIGTRVNKNGLIETIAANRPRFDFDPITGECKGLLIEESRTNLLLRSEEFDVANWIKNAASIVPNSITAPDGNTTADILIENTSLALHQVAQTVSVTVGQIYTFSVFLKSSSIYARRALVFAPSANFTVTPSATFDISNGTIVSTFNGSSSIVNYGNGWYRCILTTIAATSSGSNNFNVRLTPQSGASSSYQGDGTSGIYIWGAQVEAGAFPTSYIPTTTSTVTRSAELATMTGTNFSSWYNQTEGTFFFDGTLPFISNDSVTGFPLSAGRVPYGVSNGLNFANSMYAEKKISSLALSFSVINNNVSQHSGAAGGNMTSSNFKIASSVSPRNIYTSLYGGIVKPSRPFAAIPTVDRLTLGRESWNASPNNPMIGCIRRFTYYPKALTPPQLQYLTQ